MRKESLWIKKICGGVILPGLIAAAGCAGTTTKHIPNTPTGSPPVRQISLPAQTDRADIAGVPLFIGLEQALQATPETSIELTTHPAAKGQTTHYQDMLLSLQCQNADLRKVLERFAELGGLNVIIHPEVSGIVTVRLARVSWRQALEAIVHINNCEFALEGTVLYVFRAP